MSLKGNVAAAAAALTIVVAPAFASAQALNVYPRLEARHGHSKLNTVPGTFALASSLGGAQVYQARGAQRATTRAPNGRDLGTDPDTAIRRELRRDWLRGGC